MCNSLISSPRAISRPAACCFSLTAEAAGAVPPDRHAASLQRLFLPRRRTTRPSGSAPAAPSPRWLPAWRRRRRRASPTGSDDKVPRTPCRRCPQGPRAAPGRRSDGRLRLWRRRQLMPRRRGALVAAAVLCQSAAKTPFLRCRVSCRCPRGER